MGYGKWKVEGEGVTVLRGYIKKTGSALGWHIKDGARLFYTDKMEMVHGGEKKNINRVHCLKNTGEKKGSCFEGRKDGDAIQKNLV